MADDYSNDEKPWISDPNHEGVDSWWYDRPNPNYRSGMPTAYSLPSYPMSKYENLEDKLGTIGSVIGFSLGALVPAGYTTYTIISNGDYNGWTIFSAGALALIATPFAMIIPGIPLAVFGGDIGENVAKGINYIRKRVFHQVDLQNAPPSSR